MKDNLHEMLACLWHPGSRRRGPGGRYPQSGTRTGKPHDRRHGEHGGGPHQGGRTGQGGHPAAGIYSCALDASRLGSQHHRLLVQVAAVPADENPRVHAAGRRAQPCPRHRRVSGDIDLPCGRFLQPLRPQPRHAADRIGHSTVSQPHPGAAVPLFHGRLAGGGGGGHPAAAARGLLGHRRHDHLQGRLVQPHRRPSPAVVTVGA